MTITEFTKLIKHPIINFRQLCNAVGINYNKMWAKVDNERELTAVESQQIEQYLSANGIKWETLIQSQGK